MTQLWNPELEQLDRQQLRSLQLRKFRELCLYAAEHSPFYRDRFEAAGIDPGAITSFDTVREVPTTPKSALREAQQTEPFPYGDLLAGELTDVTEYHQTSGTTGEPLRQADSWRDWEWWVDCWATVLWAQGIRPEDRVFFPFSYNVFIAFWAGHYACEKIGAEVVPGGNLSSTQRVRKMDELDVTAFMSTPTYALRLAEVAEEEGLAPASMAVKRIVCAGEPGASIPGTRDRIESRWGADVFDHAGATEAGAFGFSCEGDSLGLHFNESMFLVEVLDEENQPVDPGEEGRLVVTPLDRRAQPYIRFELRDKVELASHEACDCGRTFRIAQGGILGRIDDLRKVNGVLLSPTAIEDVVRSFDHVADEYQVLIDDHERKDVDSITLRAERAPGTDSPEEEIVSALRKELKQTTSLGFRIDLQEYESLHRPELKADRLRDERDRNE